MTNEEIEREVLNAVAKQLMLHPYLKPGDDVSPIADALSDVARALVSRAYEEAAAAMCGLCASGARVLHLREFPEEKWGAWDGDTLVHEHFPWTNRPTEPEYAACDAQSIRALKDSLAQELVSSS